ncbi:hypothetical protein F4677DRAFT_440622 [Hypoxylon crocopeplum]|nr:hypothetical protein F4677DRAFT_440622 [Hypoxylon crocopeplum]
MTPDRRVICEHARNGNMNNCPNSQSSSFMPRICYIDSDDSHLCFHCSSGIPLSAEARRTNRIALRTSLVRAGRIANRNPRALGAHYADFMEATHRTSRPREPPRRLPEVSGLVQSYSPTPLPRLTTYEAEWSHYHHRAQAFAESIDHLTTTLEPAQNPGLPSSAQAGRSRHPNRPPTANNTAASAELPSYIQNNGDPGPATASSQAQQNGTRGSGNGQAEERLNRAYGHMLSLSRRTRASLNLQALRAELGVLGTQQNGDRAGSGNEDGGNGDGAGAQPEDDGDGALRADDWSNAIPRYDP